MNTFNTLPNNGIRETEILINVNGLTEVEYEVHCYDAIAYGRRTDNNENAPYFIKMSYPTRDEIIADEDKARYVLEYRGLFDLTTENIHYGDIMMAYGEVVEASSQPMWENTYRMVGWINHPDIMGCPTEDAIKDYKRCQEGFNNAFELLNTKYSLRGGNEGNCETFPSDERYIVKEDADGIYLFEIVE